jgi:aminocarboxymuconate-semialdehyde decarboxylase
MNNLFVCVQIIFETLAKKSMPAPFKPPEEYAVLIDIHAHLVTKGMLNRHEFWGPFMKTSGFTVGHLSLGTKQPSKA